jgi:hypothetical protein
MHEDLHTVEREGEQVVSVAPDGPDHVLVGTVWIGQTRPYSAGPLEYRAVAS